MPSLPHFNVMIVEDEPLLLRALENLIEQLDAGFVVTASARDGASALHALADNDIHLVITDIVMPVVSGLDLLEQLGQRRPNLPVILLSGRSDFEFAQKALRGGALDYILKPVSREKLENALLKAKTRLSAHYQIAEDESLSGTSSEQAIQYARDYLRAHFADAIELAALAKQLGFSAAYLTKLFHKYEKCTPVKYLTELRINEAKNLLYSTDLPIKEISERVGYDNQFYFSRVFRKSVQLTPSEYRERKRQPNA